MMDMFREQLMGIIMTKILLGFSTVAMLSLGVASTEAADLDQHAPEEQREVLATRKRSGDASTAQLLQGRSL